jgi:hypothetical protein
LDDAKKPPVGFVAMDVSHRTHSMLNRYNIVSEADLRSAMRRTQEYLKEAERGSAVAVMPDARAAVN